VHVKPVVEEVNFSIFVFPLMNTIFDDYNYHGTDKKMDTHVCTPIFPQKIRNSKKKDGCNDSNKAISSGGFVKPVLEAVLDNMSLSTVGV